MSSLKSVLDIGNLMDIANYIASKDCNIDGLDITVNIPSEKIFRQFMEEISIKYGDGAKIEGDEFKLNTPVGVSFVFKYNNKELSNNGQS